MGSTYITGFINKESMSTEESVKQILSIHFSANHYPPIPQAMVDPAYRAIKNAERGLWDKKVSLRGTGAEHRTYGALVPTHVLIEAWHLDSFIPYDEDEDEYFSLYEEDEEDF